MTETAGPHLTLQTIEHDDTAGTAQIVEAWSEFGSGLASTYPQVFHPLGRGRSHGLCDDRGLASHAATYDVEIRTPDGPVAATLIGSVATRPDARGHGLASALLEQLVARAAGAGRDTVLLWSEQWSFYQRLAFQPKDRQYEVELCLDHSALAAGVRPAQAGDLPALWELHRRKPIGAERGLDDWAILLSASPMATVVLERQGQVTAYACHGKGLDFHGWWHEVGGADEDVAELLPGAMTALGQRSATAMVPLYRRNLIERLGPRVSSVTDGIGALRRPLTARGRGELFLDGLDSI